MNKNLWKNPLFSVTTAIVPSPSAPIYNATSATSTTRKSRSSVRNAIGKQNFSTKFISFSAASDNKPISIVTSKSTSFNKRRWLATPLPLEASPNRRPHKSRRQAQQPISASTCPPCSNSRRHNNLSLSLHS